MKALLSAAILATALALPAAAAERSPVFGSAKATVTSKVDNQKVVGKGYYADYYGYYGDLYAGYATTYSSYAYYYSSTNAQEANYYSYAATYAYYAYSYYNSASYYASYGQ